jgi:hypothetical protein
MKRLGVVFVDKNDDPSTKHVPIRELHSEPGAEDLLDSPEMEPYMNLMLAEMQGKDTAPALAELAALPLEKRYVWRVASALKWAFADSETMNVEADRKTLSIEDRSRLLDLLQHRPLQFCLFLSALIGQKEMEVLMISALKNARVIAAYSDSDPL